MEISLLIHGDESGWESLDEAAQQKMYAGHGAFMRAVQEAGVKIVYSAELEPSGGSRLVRVTGTGHVVTDGPYSETKEQLGGFYVLDLPSLDEAVEWAKRIPQLPGDTIEVRAGR